MKNLAAEAPQEDADKATPVTGGCICGGVRYEVSDRSKLRQVIACHCEQCRRFSGHFVAASGARYEHFTWLNDETLRWYAYRPNIRQGFCGECGCSLFFDYPKGSRLSIAAGSLDDSSGISIVAQIYCAEAGQYYQVSQEGEMVDGGNVSVACPD
ncbi:MAG: aldehyde-activating protein [Proteobacteria bacterium]|nr:MAG: aldehyde-activating protein [Pseudomonadota bacterium]